MPTPYLKKLAKKHGKPISEMEHLWSEAKSAAAKQGKAKDWAYITGILQRMVGEKSSAEMPELQMTDDLMASQMISHTVYCSALDTLLLPEGTELSWSIPGPLGHFLEHMRQLVHELVDGLKIGINEIINALKSRSIFALLKGIGFNIMVLFKAIVKLASLGPTILEKTLEDLEKGGWLRKLQSGAVNVDDFLHAHPALTHIGGVGIAALLIVMWLNTMFTGSPRHDLDLTDILKALTGHFDVKELFTSPEGLSAVIMCLTAVSGAHALSGVVNAITWLGSNVANLGLCLVYTGAVKAGEHKLVEKIKPFILRKPSVLEHTVDSSVNRIISRLSKAA